MQLTFVIIIALHAVTPPDRSRLSFSKFLLCLLTWASRESSSNFLLFLFRVNDEQMCSGVLSSAVHASSPPLKIHFMQKMIAEVMTLNV